MQCHLYFNIEDFDALCKNINIINTDFHLLLGDMYVRTAEFRERWPYISWHMSFCYTNVTFFFHDNL